MPVVHVAVAVIQDQQGRVLLSRRHDRAHQGGLWEFPGGKLEPGETLSQALRREIWEELGLRIAAHRPLIAITHHYGDRSVLLDVHQVTGYAGVAAGLEGQPLAWVAPDALADYRMPAADRPICAAIRLPASYLITGGPEADTDRFLQRLRRALADGQRLVQLRAPGLAADDYLQLADKALAVCRRHRARLLLNADPRLLDRVPADGIHLNSRRLMGLHSRPVADDKWLAASCHDTAQLRQAERIGADFAVVSPVLPTASHAEAEPIGWQRFASLADSACLPVYALGGMRPEMLSTARAAGAQGIAAIRSLWPQPGNQELSSDGGKGSPRERSGIR